MFRLIAVPFGWLALGVSLLLRVSGRYRGLDAGERRDAESVFGARGIDFDAVRIAAPRSLTTTWALRCSGRRPFTIGHSIHCDPRGGMSRATLIHELVHVWQAERFGCRYMLEALFAQWFGEGYTVTDAHLRDWQGDFARLNREQQAVVVERWFCATRGGHDARGRADVAALETYARQVRDASHA